MRYLSLCHLVMLSLSSVSVLARIAPGPKPIPMSPSTTDLPSPPSGVPSDRPYNVKLNPFPIMYTDAQKAAQVQAGTQMVKSLYNFLSTRPSDAQATYTVPPGVYRLTERINFYSIFNARIIMANVEILTTTNDAHMFILGGNNLEIAGPLTLDADPIPASQGIIVGGDFKSYIDVQTMPGYRSPSLGSRVMGFTPDGVLQRHYQDSISSVTSRGNNTYRITLPGLNGYSTYTTSLIAKAFAIGNYLSSESNGTTATGGMYIGGTGDLYMHDIYYNVAALTECQDIAGNMRLVRWMGQRRNNTNRLSAGGWMQCQFNGGSFDMTASEISYNMDDLTDMGGYMGIAMAGPTPNSLYVVLHYPDVGRSFKFYDATTLANLGNATLTAVNSTTVSQSVQNQFRLYANAASASTYRDRIPILVTFDKPIKGNSKLFLADDIQAQPKYMSVTNSYFHDNLASGIQLKGAKSIVATGNVIRRVALFAVFIAFSAYWLEGGVAGSGVMSNNYCVDTPFTVGFTGSTIQVGTEDYQASHATNNQIFKNISILSNTIINPQLGAIQVENIDGSSIIGNKVYNGATYATTSDSRRPPYMISVQSSQNVVVSNNALININKTAGVAGPIADQYIVSINSRTLKNTVTTSGNSNANGTTNLPIGILDTTGY